MLPEFPHLQPGGDLSQELSIHSPVGVAGTDFRALSQTELLVEGLSVGCEQLALVSDSCSCV